ncbi:hypothetical protein ACFL35_18765, partial [Candidatus Riflebacteria bacterium]
YCQEINFNGKDHETQSLNKHIQKNALKILGEAEEVLFFHSHLFSLKKRMAIEHGTMMLESALLAEDNEMVNRFMLELTHLVRKKP